MPLLWQSEGTEANGYGNGNLESWQATIDIAAQYEVIPESFDASEMVLQPADIGN